MKIRRHKHYDPTPTASCESYRLGDNHRAIHYGKSRAQVIQELKALFGRQDGWEDEWVVTKTRYIEPGLSRAWTLGKRGFDAYGQRV